MIDRNIFVSSLIHKRSALIGFIGTLLLVFVTTIEIKAASTTADSKTKTLKSCETPIKKALRNNLNQAQTVGSNIWRKGALNNNKFSSASLNSSKNQAIAPMVSLNLTPIAGPDTFGYQAFQFYINPTFSDISGTGTGIPSTTGDDTAGTFSIGIAGGFNLYGTLHTQMRAATNGYLTSNLGDLSGDTSNDCAVFPNCPAACFSFPGDRIIVLHDDLNVNGQIVQQYFSSATSPYTNPDGSGSNGAHVIQWDDVRNLSGTPTTWDMQAILFDNFNILLMYGAGNPLTGSGSTTGLQNQGVTDGLLVACNTAGSIPDNHAIFLLHPNNLVPTSAAVNIGGRVTTAKGNGIRGAIVYLTDLDGTITAKRTNPFGYYQFSDVQAGETYVLTVQDKAYSFDEATRVISVDEENLDINIVATGRSSPRANIPQEDRKSNVKRRGNK